MRTRRRTLGQSVTEYILTVSILVIAAAALSYDPLRLGIEAGAERLSNKVEQGSNQGGYGMQGCGACQR